MQTEFGGLSGLLLGTGVRARVRVSFSWKRRGWKDLTMFVLSPALWYLLFRIRGDQMIGQQPKMFLNNITLTQFTFTIHNSPQRKITLKVTVKVIEQNEDHRGDEPQTFIMCNNNYNNNNIIIIIITLLLKITAIKCVIIIICYLWTGFSVYLNTLYCYNNNVLCVFVK